ncbi:hypothetical protein AB4Y89_15985 [Terriglobus sp. 2YAB30_2]|uniref:hypothetical protein n=1 Tax=unclassified Terriglobus TaxID=2628988 RepID=UPI003F9BE7F1
MPKTEVQPLTVSGDSGSGGKRNLLFWMLCIAGCFQFAQGFSITLGPAFTLQDFAYGHVESPYRRRIFMEWVYRAFLHLHGTRLFHLGKRTMTPEQQVLFLTGFIASLLMVVVTWTLIRQLLGRQTPWQWISLAAIYMLDTHELLSFDIRAQFPYDLTTPIFFGTGLYALISRKRWLYYVAFLVGTLNRETTMFLPLLFVVCSLPEEFSLRQAWRQIRPLVLVEAAAQLVVWQLLVMWCEQMTGGHGTGIVISWQNNLRIVSNPTHWPLFASTFGFLWIPLVLFHDRVSDTRLRRCAYLLPLWVAVMFYTGDPLEIRLYNEWIPYMTACLALIASNSLLIVRRGNAAADRPAQAVQNMIAHS